MSFYAEGRVNPQSAFVLALRGPDVSRRGVTRMLAVPLSDLLTLVWSSAHTGRRLGAEILDPLGQWAGHVTDAEIDQAAREADEFYECATDTRRVLKAWRRSWCPDGDGRPRSDVCMVSQRVMAQRRRAGEDGAQP